MHVSYSTIEPNNRMYPSLKGQAYMLYNFDVSYSNIEVEEPDNSYESEAFARNSVLGTCLV